MGSCASKPKQGDNPQACVSFYPQVCTRKQGEEWCHLHPGHKVTLLCRECKMLLCVECLVTSADHKGHTTTLLSKCLREPVSNIGKKINNIDRQKKTIIEKEISVLVEDLKRYEHIELTQIEKIMTSDLVESTKTDHIQQYKRYTSVVTNIHNYHVRLLWQIVNNLSRNQLNLVNVLQSGSDVIKYDTGMYQETDVSEQTPNKPQIPELTNMKDIDDVMDKLQHVLERISKTYIELVHTSMYIDCLVFSVFDNESLHYYSVTPVSTDTAWVGESILYNEHDEEYYPSNKLLLITSKGTALRHIAQQMFT